MTISAFSDELAQVRTKKKEFLSQIERIVPWGEWLAMIQPCYYKGERGNKPYPLETMLRLYLLQNLYDLSDEATVAEAIDSRAFSEFCGVDSSNQVPDGDTLGRFRNLLIRNGLQEKLFAQVVAALMERGLILKKGTIVDSTIISAPSSIRNKEKKRDPDAHQVKKGNTWHFGYKAHIGVDKDSGLVHTVKATAANPSYPSILYRLTHCRNRLSSIPDEKAVSLYDAPARTFATSSYFSSTVHTLFCILCRNASGPQDSSILNHLRIIS